MENISKHIKLYSEKGASCFKKMMTKKKGNMSYIVCLAQSRIWDIGENLNSKSPNFDWLSPPPNMAGPKMRRYEHNTFFGFSALNGNGYGYWLAKTNLLPSFLLLLLNLVSHTSVPCVYSVSHTNVPSVYSGLSAPTPLRQNLQQNVPKRRNLESKSGG